MDGADGRSPLAAATVQVIGRDGGVAGAGFLAAGGVVLTCAHVVRAAGIGPGGELTLAFPGLPGAPRLPGTVLAEGWRSRDAEDVAVVRLAGAPPGVAPLALGAARGCRGHRVASFGFPAQAPPGGHFGYGEAGDLLGGDGLLQLSRANDLTTGFSGGAVVDEVTGLVIGMVTSIAAPDPHLKGQDIAYATPAEVLREVWPELTERRVTPYRGLEPFTAEHAEWFNGRAAAVEKVLTGLDGQGRVLLLGPSGSGKSSLIQAGVLPKLAGGRLPGGDRWLPVLARPGRDLPAELARAGLPGAATDGVVAAAERRLAAEPGRRRVLLVIDQLEELLTQPDAAAVAWAADQLAAAIRARSVLRVVMVLRDDFYPRLAALAPELLEAAEPGVVHVPALLTADELRDIIVRPAHAAGARFEDGLAERIIADLMAERQTPVTVLPLLEVTLTQLWEDRRDGRLTHATYHRNGAVTGALNAWCDTALADLPAAHRPLAQRTLTALVRPADEAQAIPATRRQVPLDDLRALAGEGPFDEVLAALARHRIVITRAGRDGGPPTAELMHDALIRDWHELRDWIAADHQFQAWLLRAGDRHANWQRSGLPGDLLDGTDLDAGLAWSRQRGLPDAIAAFVAASHQRQRAAARRTRRLNAVLACLLVLALAAAGLAFWQQERAVSARQDAEAEREIAQSRELAAQSAALLETDPDLASLLAVQAYRTHPTEEAIESLYTAAGLPLRAIWDDPIASTESVAFSPDGTLLATGDWEGEVRVFDAATGESGRAFGEGGRIYQIAFSPDGTTLAAADYDKVRLLDVDTGEERSPLEGEEFADVYAVAFSPDGSTLAGAGPDGTVRLWEPATGDIRRTLGHGTVLHSVAYSPDGTVLVTGDAEGTVSLWDAATGTLSGTLTGHTGTVNAVAFSPDGSVLATAGDDGAVRLWDLGAGAPSDTLFGEGGPVTWVAFSPDGSTLATSHRDRFVRLWDVGTGNVRQVLPHGESSATFSPDGTTLAAGGPEETLRLWNVAGGSTVLTGHSENVQSVAFSPDGALLATGSDDSTVRLWDPATGEARETLTSPDPGAITEIAFSPDGTTLAAGGMDGLVRLWDTGTGEIRGTLSADTDAVSALAYSPDGSTLATAGRDGVKLWDTATGDTRDVLTDEGDGGGVRSLAFSPDGTTLATGGWDGVKLWEITTGEVADTLAGMNSLYWVAFSPDGTTLAVVEQDLPGSSGLGGDATLRLWDLASGETRDIHNSGTQRVSRAAFSPDGHTLATVGSDGPVRLWDVRTLELRDTLIGHTDLVTSLAYSPDGTFLATAGWDLTVRLWREMALPAPEEAITHICGVLGRDLTSAERAAYLPDQSAEPVCGG
ncbi:nSTAND1 domain-containing NTPase [Streptomyces litchfieldiae]|uniref:Trypsin-like peptidase domain-containing protein n=1 Tax=Streptomyces litchfieldiae TaxID=3075543 RepID=A0ABU2MP88_9ACTN|nr:trypsin-like peptidase domain-containing protein [Streptomyces sp. DSM 44938]MDT0343276.1 trypsin-like peptidase domain-containing protein [Streptomyces sp. DSM 44938]